MSDSAKVRNVDREVAIVFRSRTLQGRMLRRTATECPSTFISRSMLRDSWAAPWIDHPFKWLQHSHAEMEMARR